MFLSCLCDRSCGITFAQKMVNGEVRAGRDRLIKLLTEMGKVTGGLALVKSFAVADQLGAECIRDMQHKETGLVMLR